MNSWDLPNALPFIAAVVDALRAVALLQKAVGKVSPRLAPDLGVVVAVLVHKVNFSCFVSAACKTDALTVFIKHIFLWGFRKSLALLAHRAHSQEDMGMGIAAACVMDIEVGAHSFGNKWRGTVFTDKP